MRKHAGGNRGVLAEGVQRKVMNPEVAPPRTNMGLNNMSPSKTAAKFAAWMFQAQCETFKPALIERKQTLHIPLESFGNMDSSLRTLYRRYGSARKSPSWKVRGRKRGYGGRKIDSRVCDRTEAARNQSKYVACRLMFYSFRFVRLSALCFWSAHICYEGHHNFYYVRFCLLCMSLFMFRCIGGLTWLIRRIAWLYFLRIRSIFGESMARSVINGIIRLTNWTIRQIYSHTFFPKE